jgi:crotonobetainyl-CoA:carnitine CoA-transferase CaiB-like acyl-CoA transferase
MPGEPASIPGPNSLGERSDAVLQRLLQLSAEQVKELRGGGVI